MRIQLILKSDRGAMGEVGGVWEGGRVGGDGGGVGGGGRRVLG
jgi:hypothetical protein